MQAYLKVADANPHPRATEILQRIEVDKVINKQVRCILNFKREGFDAVQKMDKDMLRSYFGECSPSEKAYQTQRGEDEFFHEVSKFTLEVTFVSPCFYCMPKTRAGFIISTFDGEVFNGGLLTSEVLQKKLDGVKNGKPMKLIFA